MSAMKSMDKKRLNGSALISNFHVSGELATYMCNSAPGSPLIVDTGVRTRLSAASVLHASQSPDTQTYSSNLWSANGTQCHREYRMR